MPTICFTQEDMDRFAHASGDVNPLHVDRVAGEVRRIEAPVVYGVLGVLAAIGALQAQPDTVLHRLEASFSRPLFVGCDYEIDVLEGKGMHATVCISDGGLRAFTVRASCSPGRPTPHAPVREAHRRLQRPQARTLRELERNPVATGFYGASPGALEWLRERFPLQACDGCDYALHGLLYASYLIGMELPGAGSTMLRLQLALAPAIMAERGGLAGSPAAPEPLTYRSRVADLEAQVGVAIVSSILQHGGRPVAMLTCQALLPDPRSERINAPF